MKKSFLAFIAFSLLIVLCGCSGKTSDNTSDVSEITLVSSRSESNAAAEQETEALRNSLSEANEALAALQEKWNAYGLGSTDFMVQDVYQFDGYARFLFQVEYDYNDEEKRRCVLLFDDHAQGDGCEVVYESAHIGSVCVKEQNVFFTADNAIRLFDADSKKTATLVEIPAEQSVSSLIPYDAQGVSGLLYLASAEVCFYDFSGNASRKIIECASSEDRIIDLQLFATGSSESEPAFVLLTVYTGEDGRAYHMVTAETLQNLIKNQKTVQLSSETQIYS